MPWKRSPERWWNAPDSAPFPQVSVHIGPECDALLVSADRSAQVHHGEREEVELLRQQTQVKVKVKSKTVTGLNPGTAHQGERLMEASPTSSS